MANSVMAVDQDQQWLLSYLSATLDPNQDVRSFAEASLNQASHQPGFDLVLSKVAANKEIPVGLRQVTPNLFGNPVANTAAGTAGGTGVMPGG